MVDEGLRLTYGCVPGGDATWPWKRRSRSCVPKRWLSRSSRLTGGTARGWTALPSASPATARAQLGEVTPLLASPPRELARTIEVWQLSQAKAAASFRVSRQAFSKWLQRGVPADHAVAVADPEGRHRLAGALSQAGPDTRGGAPADTGALWCFTAGSARPGRHPQALVRVPRHVRL